jgi:5,10-methylenetetrahydromethanopterin reductase
MRIGVMIGDSSPNELVRKAKALEERGFDTAWMANFIGHGLETLSAMTLIARETRRIKLGTAVIPIYLHHPVALAHQAMTIQKVAQGRFTLGIGLSHPSIVEEWLGLSYDSPAEQMSEYLSILRPLLNGESVEFKGAYFSTKAGVHLGDVQRVPLLVAALGSKMLKLAGEMADGTITYLTGPRTLETHIIPRIRAAAEKEGQPAPRIVAGGLPMALVDNMEQARAAIAQQFAGYTNLPSYRAMFEREGVKGPADIAIVGDASVLEESLHRLEQIGVTDFLASLVPAGEDAVERTMDFLAAQL